MHEEVKHQQPRLSDGLILTRDNRITFDQKYLTKKLQEQLGFNPYTLFKSKEEENELKTIMTNLELEKLMMKRELEKNNLEEMLQMHIESNEA
jgi:hypothetical protein